jgi:DNA processing protein
MLNTRETLGAWLRLSLTEGVGPDSARRLLAAFGPPEAIFQQSEVALRQCVSAQQAKALQTVPQEAAALTDTTWQWLQDGANTKSKTNSETGMGRAVVTLGERDYPSALLQIPDPPLMLYALGQTHALQLLLAEHTVAIVGSRNPTPQGHSNAREFARSLCASGLTIVSGLALGIDGAAHEGALLGAPDRPPSAHPLATIAVVGTGLDRVYPRQHLGLAHQIALRGLILSEYPLGTPPLRAHFPQRNRLISGLSQATLVVEAALPSGSLITAKQALEQGRDVLAIPGSIHAAQSKGCHWLIKQGAKLVESAQDVLEEMPNLAKRPDGLERSEESADPETDNDLFSSPDESVLLSALGHDPVSLDALQARSGLSTATLQGQLMELELMGQVGRLPGGLFQRVSRG